MGFAPSDRLELPWSYNGPRWGHQDPLLFMGSCFAERMGARLQRHLFDVVWQPAGTLFDPLSLHHHLQAYLGLARDGNHGLDLDDWVEREGVWHRWDMHSDCSDTDRDRAIQKLKLALERGAEQLSKAHTLVLTLGTAYVYFLASDGRPVANCHRFPSSNFERRLVTVEEMHVLWEEILEELQAWRPDLQVWFTVSPVRHARDGLVENNRSKARLLELAHRLTDGCSGRTYFPTYEWQIDVLRDYRYYDTDLVHPNYAATSYMYDRLVQYAMKPEAVALLPRLESLVTADAHRSRLADSLGNPAFEKQRELQWKELFRDHPYLAQRRKPPVP
ncbi:MAG: GSCFA domain-containing protein [Bacteroidota bacterium]